MLSVLNDKSKFSNRAKLVETAVYAVMLLFWLWVYFNAPYLHDDWYWGTGFGPRALITGNTNGRYMGNLVIVAITRSTALKTILCGLVTWLIPFCISRLASSEKQCQRIAVFLFANLMIFTVNKLMWEETIGWLSGFANYVTSGMCLALFYVLIKRGLSEGSSLCGSNCLALLFVFMCVSTLFVENLSIYFVLVSLCAFVLNIIRKKEYRPLLAMFAGAIAGTVFMFSSPSYSGLLKGEGSEIRKLTVSLASSVLEIISSTLSAFGFHLPGMFELNTFLCLALLLAMAAVLVSELGKGSVWKPVCILLNGLLSVLLVLFAQGITLPTFLMKADGNSYLSLVFFLLMSFELLLLLFLGKDKQVILKLGFLWLSVIFVILPLTVTKSGGERLYFSIMVLCTLFCVEAYLCLEEQGRVYNKMGKALFAALSCACLIMVLNIANTYRVIGEINREHMQIITQVKENGEKRLAIPEYLPNHNKYLADWSLDNNQKNPYVEKFKEFYGVDNDVEFVLYYRD